MTKRIVLDMDGTIANLYSVPNWLEQLREYSTAPYLIAAPMENMRKLARELNRLRNLGYEICIVSWLSKESNATYDSAVRFAKQRWLAQHLGSVNFHSVHLVKYGTYKHRVENAKDAILFDDNAAVRKLWIKHGGVAIDPKNGIVEYLRGLE